MAATVPAGARPDWTEPFARTIDAAKKYVVSSTLDRVDWKSELLAGSGQPFNGSSSSRARAVHGRRHASAGVGGAGIDRRVRVRRASEDAGPRTDVVRGPIEARRLEARGPARIRSGAVAMRYEPRR